MIWRAVSGWGPEGGMRRLEPQAAPVSSAHRTGMDHERNNVRVPARTIEGIHETALCRTADTRARKRPGRARTAGVPWSGLVRVPWRSDLLRAPPRTRAALRPRASR